MLARTLEIHVNEWVEANRRYRPLAATVLAALPQSHTGAAAVLGDELDAGRFKGKRTPPVFHSAFST